MDWNAIIKLEPQEPGYYEDGVTLQLSPTDEIMKLIDAAPVAGEVAFDDPPDICAWMIEGDGKRNIQISATVARDDGVGEMKDIDVDEGIWKALEKECIRVLKMSLDEMFEKWGELLEELE